MSQASDRHLAQMVMAIKRDLYRDNPLAPLVRLGPEAMEALWEGHWEALAVSCLVDFTLGRDVRLSPEAMQHLLTWLELPDVASQPVIQELIADFNARADRDLPAIVAQSRPPNRAERRRLKKGA